MKLNIHIDWKKVIVFLLVCAGLIYLTHSLWLSGGILLLLFVIDGLLANYETVRKLKEQERRRDEARRQAE